MSRGNNPDYGEIARNLMNYLSKKELEPRPHYRILLASLEEVEVPKVWETGIERHEIGYSLIDTNQDNRVYTTVLVGYVKVGMSMFTQVKLEITKKEKEPLKIRVFRGDLKNELQEGEKYQLTWISDEKVLIKIPFEIDKKSFQAKYLELEVTKRVRHTSNGTRVLLKIRNRTIVQRIKSSRSFEFGHILEFEVKEYSEAPMRVPITSYKGYSLLPAIDAQKLEGAARAHESSSPKEAFENVYLVAKTLEFRDYYISEVEIPRIKPSGIHISSLSEDLKKEAGIPLHEVIQEYIKEKIESKGSTLYRFQVEGIKEITKQLYGPRKPVLITAKTAAGKTEAFIIPIVNYILTQKEMEPEKKGVRAILMYPTKALANDQLQRIFELVAFVNSLVDKSRQITIGVYHGDIEEKATYEIPMPLKCVNPNHTEEKPRLKVKDGILVCPECERGYPFLLVDRKSILASPPDILIATPDILNYALAFDKKRHVLFYSHDGISPEIVMLDELHLFYSIFGKNVSLMLKRLESLIRYYSRQEKKIQFIGASATIRNPKRFGSSFFNSEGVHVTTKPFDYDYSKPVKKTMIFAMPLAYRMVDTAAYSLISLLQLLNEKDFKTLVFVNTLTVCDMIRSNIARRASSSPELGELIKKIGAHNSTYTKQERAEIEEMFNKGELSVLVATSTLEVGVDFKDIDLLMLYGVPYSFNSYLQRVGRAGRNRDAIVYVLLNPNNPIDITYYREAMKIVLNPDAFIEYPPFPEHNRVLERKHIISAISDFCTAQECDTNTVLSSIYLGNLNTVSDVVHYLKATKLVNSEEDLVETIYEVYDESGISSVSEDTPPFDVIKEVLRLADMRTAESVVSVTLDVYDPRYARSSRKNKYRRYGITDQDMAILRKIKPKGGYR